MTLANKVAQFNADADKVNQFTHGDDTTVVQTASGPVRSLAKLVKDNDAAINASGLLGQVNASKAAAESARAETAIARAGAEIAASTAAQRAAAALAAQNAGAIGKDTLANLNADLAHSADTVALVTNDPVSTNNTFYRKTGAAGSGAWVVSDASPLSILRQYVDSFGLSIKEAYLDGVHYPFVITDSADNVAAGITDDGRFVMFAHKALTSQNIQYIEADIFGYAWAILDASGNVAFGVKTDGSLYLGPAVTGQYAQSTPSQFSALAHIIHMGQSLAVGMESLPIITTADTGFGSLRFNMGIQTWTNTVPPSNRAPSNFSLVPMTANISIQSSDQGETIANGLCDHLKQSMIGRYAPKSAATQGTRLLFSCAGDGGRYIRELDKRHDDAKDARAGSRQSNGGYYATSLDDVVRAKAYADANGLSYAVAAVTWMQGEANNDLRVNRWDPALSLADAITTYQTDLINVKNDYNADIKAITWQTSAIPFFMYQTAGPASSVAQLQATLADPDMYMVGPTYMLPTAINSQYEPGHVHGANIHLSADGQRWLGEQFGKVIRRVCAENKGWSPLRPLSAWIDATRTKVYVRFNVSSGMLTLDTDWLPAQGAGKGFAVVGSGGSVVPTAVDVTTPDTVCLTLGAVLPAGGAYVRYAQDSYVADVSTVILAYRDGAAFPNTEPSKEIVFAGDITAEFSKLANEGVFTLSQPNPLTSLQIRQVYLDGGGNTVCRGETRELRLGVDFTVGAACKLYRTYNFGNLRDTDNEQSTFTFASGLRAGMHYPLWNWCIQFDNLTIN